MTRRSGPPGPATPDGPLLRAAARTSRSGMTSALLLVRDEDLDVGRHAQLEVRAAVGDLDLRLQHLHVLDLGVGSSGRTLRLPIIWPIS